MRVWTAISFWLALTCSGALLVIPAYSGSASRATLLQVNGSGVLIPLAIPVLFALVPLLFPQTRPVRIGAVLALCVFAFVAGFSIGVFYLPSAAAMLGAGFFPAKAQQRETSR
jgi:hypothetical protein